MVEQVGLRRKRWRQFCQMSKNEKEMLNVLLDETHPHISMKVEMSLMMGDILSNS